MPARSWLTIDDFAKEGRPLRATFDARFADPRKARADRFVWDYWHVPGQYTALRTPAEGYFPRATLSRFLDFWARELAGPLHSVTVAHARLIRPSEFRAVNGEYLLN